MDAHLSGDPPGSPFPFPPPLEGRGHGLPPLNTGLLVRNGFLRELVYALGYAPFPYFKGLKVALQLDRMHPALLFGEIALRPTFYDMFLEFRNYGVTVPCGIGVYIVHPELAAAVALVDLKICQVCRAHVARDEECWMCESNVVTAGVIASFRGVQRLHVPADLEQVVVVPPAGLPADEVKESVVSTQIPAGSLLVTMSGSDGGPVRYYRIFAGNDSTGYLRVIRVGLYDFVSYVSAVEIVAEFPAVPPGFLSRVDFSDSP